VQKNPKESMAMMQGVQKNTLYVGGLAEEVNESILHAAFIPFGDIKDVKTPLDQATQKHRSFGFVTFLEREDASAAMDNMDGAELYGRVLTVNYALPEKIKGGEQGWAAQPSNSSFLYLFSLNCFDFVFRVRV
jgi:peptidyl-prolyl isomerase E (cyclophilin E)